jgi:hypothetical protein
MLSPEKDDGNGIGVNGMIFAGRNGYSRRIHPRSFASTSFSRRESCHGQNIASYQITC